MAGALMLTSTGALAQEVMYTQAATMPSPGAFILRSQIHFSEFGTNPVSGVESTEKFEFSNNLAYGIDRGLAAYLDVPFTRITESDPDDTDTGVNDIELMLKYRFLQHDTGGVDTVRAALLGGAEMDFEDSFGVNPFFGGVITMVRGRHGFNQDLIYKFNTDGDEEDNLGGDGPSDALFFNSAYLYRIIPDQFSVETTGAWYVTAEFSGLYETNGDTELRWAPGLMYEGREVAFEIMAQFPLWNDLDRRAELDWSFGFGFRFLF